MMMYKVKFSDGTTVPIIQIREEHIYSQDNVGDCEKRLNLMINKIISDITLEQVKAAITSTPCLITVIDDSGNVVDTFGGYNTILSLEYVIPGHIINVYLKKTS